MKKKKEGGEVWPWEDKVHLSGLSSEERDALVEELLAHPYTAEFMRQALEAAFAVGREVFYRSEFERSRAEVTMLAYHYLRFKMKLPRERLFRELELNEYEKEAIAFADALTGRR
jgi:hypothetical protein